MSRFLQLGASLYVPATRDDLVLIANRRKYPALRSVIFCTEDAVRADELRRALENVRDLLRHLEVVPGLLRFIRVRNPLILEALLRLEGVERLNGFVLPKVTRHNLDQFRPAFVSAHPFEVMLTLETVEAFDPHEMAALRRELMAPVYRERVLSLRIGGNDLLNLLGLRRPAGRTIYRTPLSAVIAQLVTTFRPHGFNLTGPVFDYLDQGKVLSREAADDLAYGLFGKTAIHPRQVPLIESAYRVKASELQMAERILDESAPAVFRHRDAMCEPATQHRWASLIRERARLYGVRERQPLV